MRFSLVTLLCLTVFAACVIGLFLRPTEEVILRLPLDQQDSRKVFMATCISEDGRFCCHQNSDQILRLYDLTRAKQIAEWPMDRHIYWMQLSSNNSWISLDSSNDTPREYLEIATGKIQAEQPTTNFSILDFKRSADGNTWLEEVAGHVEVCQFHQLDGLDTFLFVLAITLFYAGVLRMIDPTPIGTKKARS